jgi:serine/threonine protein kinase
MMNQDQPIFPPVLSGIPSNQGRSQVRRELASEINNLWQARTPDPARAVLARHPDLAADKSLVLDLAYEEYCLRLKDGEAPDPDAFCEGFPAYQTSLRRLIAMHHFLEGKPSLLREVPVTPWPEVGQTFLGFALQRELGRGAFARVFLATEAALGDRRVAVKISLQGAAEAKTLGPLSHPHIVSVHYVQEDPDTGLTAICMPYCGRATLHDVLDHAFAGPDLPTRAQVILEAVADKEADVDETQADQVLHHGSYVEGVVFLAVRLAEALDFIHQKGICHRDLKPSNVLLRPDGQPMLLDFNLSFDERFADQRLGGTLPYMSPEHLWATDLGRPADPSVIDARSDLFSLGVILYELLSGKYPFGPISPKLSAEQLRALLFTRQKKGPRSLRRLNPQVDRKLAQLIKRCLAYDPKDRPQTAREVADSLRLRLSHIQSKYGPTERGKASRWSIQYPLTMLYAAGLATAVFTGAWIVTHRDSPPARPDLSSQPFIDRFDYFLQRAKDASEAGRHQEALLAVEQALAHRLPALINPLFVADQNLVQAITIHSQAFIQPGIEEGVFDENWREEDLVRHGRSLAQVGYFLLKNRGLNKDAIPLLRRALAAGFKEASVDNNKEKASVHNNLAYAQWRMSDLDEAKKNLDEAIRLAPHLQAAWSNRAQVDLAKFTNRPPMQAAGPEDLGDMVATVGVASSLPAVYGYPSLVALSISRRHIPFQGICDIQQALALEPKVGDWYTGELYHVAARLCAVAARQHIYWKQQHIYWKQQALDNLQKAVALGCPRWDAIFDIVLKGDPQLEKMRLQKKVEAPSQRVRQLVDPCPPADEVAKSTGVGK